jgi:hypothetical protein
MLHDKFREFVHKSKLSIWLVLIFIILAESQMWPGLHQIVWLPIFIAWGFLLRWVARFEGRHGNKPDT